MPLKESCDDPPTGANLSQPRNPNFAAHSWKLESIRDVYGHEVRYIYGTSCSEDYFGEYCHRFSVAPHIPETVYAPFPQPNTQLTNQFRTEGDVALYRIEYNFSGSTAQSVIEFSYTAQNRGVLNHLHNIPYFPVVGNWRPGRLVIYQAGQVVSAYTFTYNMLSDYTPTYDLFTNFWWLTSITPYGSDYNPANGSGTALPTQTFSYEQNTSSCGDNGGPVCIPILTKVDNGYGGVTRFVYDRYNQSGVLDPAGKWFVVREQYTWDGVRYPYGANHTAASRLYYDRTGYIACFDTEGNGCRQQSPSPEPTDSLIGFHGVTLSTQTHTAGNWATLSKSQEEFELFNYWKRGKTVWQRTFNPATGAELTEEQFIWALAGANNDIAQLTRQDHYIYADGLTLHTYETFSYQNGAGEYGALSQRQEYDHAGVIFRCSQHAYAHQTDTVWLVNRPLRQTLYDGNCGGPKLAETLYRYDAPTSPTDTDLNGKAALEYTLVWRGNTTGDGNYLTTRQTYYSSGANAGLPHKTITYNDYSSTTAFPLAASIRNATTVLGYNVLGLPTSSQTTGHHPTNPPLPTTETQSISYDSIFAWQPASITDTNNEVTSYTYDKFGRLIKLIRPGDSPASPTIQYTYFDDPTYTGGAIFVSPLLIETAYKSLLQENVRQFYDGLGRLVQEQSRRAEVRYSDDSFGQRDVLTTYAYDARGLLTCQSMPYDVAPYVSNGQTPYRNDVCTSYAHTANSYDMLGRVVKTINPDGTIPAYHHYGLSNLNGEMETYHDVIDANRHRTQQQYDEWGRLVKVYEISGDCGSYWASEGFGCVAPYTTNWVVYATTRYGYNKLDQLEDVWDNANNNTQMSYNALGQKLTMNDPDMGNWTYTYEAAGNLTRQLDARNNALCFYYDAFNQLKTKSWQASGAACPTSVPTTTDPNHLATYSYGSSAAGNNIGRLTQVQDTSGSHTFVYDDRGRVTSESRLINGNGTTFTMGYAYDALDRMTSQTYPNGEVVATTYNNQGLPDYLSGTNTYVNTAQYNRMGQMKILDLGNGLKTWYGYNGYEAFGQDDQYDTQNVTWNWVPRYGQLWRICTAPDASDRCLAANKDLTASDQRLDIRHAFDAAGNVSNIRDYLNNNQVQTFSYDHRNRLETAYTNAVGQGQYTHNGEPNDYDYSEIGNILRLGNGNTYNYTSAWNASCPTPLPTQALPHAVRQIDSTTSYFCYDKNGNMIRRVEGGVTYTQNFNVENRLTSVVKSGSTTTFVYDADGQRMKTVEPSGKTLYYPFPGYEVEVNGGVTMKRLTYSLGGQTVAQRETGLGLAENYDDNNATGWTAHTGSWAMQNTGAGYAYNQTNTTYVAANSSYSLSQSGAMVYEWQTTFNSGSSAAGLHFMASTAADDNHGNSYLVWQNSGSIVIYETINNTLYNRASASLSAANGQTYRYRATYASGVITVWRNDVQVLSWTDSSPLTSGSYIAWRTNQSNVSFDNLRVLGTPSSYNTLVYLHGDHLGSIGAVTTSGGALLDTTRFYPFGGYRGSDPAFLTERGFTGHKQNDSLGLIYMNARYYVGSIGRFASADTLVPDQNDPQALNRYAYARNNPLKYVDPSGHCYTFYAEAPAEVLEQCLTTVGSAVSFYASLMQMHDQGLSDEQLAEIRGSWEQTLRIEDAEMLRDHFASQSQMLLDQRTAGQPEAAPICNYWEDCYEPVFNGEYAIEFGTPIGALEFSTEGTRIVEALDIGGCIPVPPFVCGIGSVEGHINSDERYNRLSSEGNLFVGFGVGGELGKVGMGAWAGSEGAMSVDQSHMVTASVKNLVHGEVAGFSIELSYTSSKVTSK
jgi:RHS repeat-associated protein